MVLTGLNSPTDAAFLVVSFGCYMNWRERAKAARIALLVVSFGCYGLWFFASHPIL